MINQPKDIILSSSPHIKRQELERILLYSCLFSLFLTLLRIIYTGEFLFAWLNWNLFLAYVPYAITRLIAKRPGWIKTHLQFAAAFLLWLLFIPNAFYIITDLFHLSVRPPVPQWFDLALILSFVWNGLILGTLSVRQMEKLLTLRYRMRSEWLFVFTLMLLNALGIYVGRYLRYNSWDVVSNPFQLLNDLFYLIGHPIRNRADWSMIFCYSVFMTLIYITLKKISRDLR